MDVPERWIAAESFVAAVARQRAFDASIANRSAHLVGRNETLVGERLIEVSQQLEHGLGRKCVAVDLDRAVIGLVMASDGTCRASLVEVAIGECDIERDGPRTRPAAQPGD